MVKATSFYDATLKDIVLVVVEQEYEDPQDPPDGLTQEHVSYPVLVKETVIVPRFVLPETPVIHYEAL